MPDRDRMKKLVERINGTSDADFVKRLLDERRKVLENPDGSVSTHELAYVDDGDGNAVVYPEVQSSMYGLMRQPSSNAYDRAVERGDTLHMSVPDAELFTTGYKDYYPGFNDYSCGGRKFDGGGKYFRTSLENESPLMYDPILPSVPDVPVPVRYEPLPHYGLYEYPTSIGMAQNYPMTLPRRASVVPDNYVEPVVEASVSDLFSDEAKARRALKQRYAESAFNDRARSKAGAQGAWQIMPITLKDYLGRGRGKSGDLNDPEYNRKVRDWVMGIIPRDLKEFWSDSDSDRAKLAKLYAAYNWGAGNLRSFLRKKRDAGVDISNPDNWVEDLNPETRRYVKYLAFDEDIPDSTVYTNAAFEKAASERGFASGGSIHIAPSKRGTFTAAAKKHGKSVQAFASQVLANKENYSPAMVKKANFARNAAKWKHGDGGPLDKYGDNTVRNALSVLRKKMIYDVGGVLSDEDDSIPKNTEEYINQKREEARISAHEKSVKQAHHVVPIKGYVDGLPVYGDGCLYTALDNYGDRRYMVAGNRQFASEPEKFGFNRISVSEILPGDVVQRGGYNDYDPGYVPGHGMIFDGYDENGQPLFNYSRGSDDPNAPSDIQKHSPYQHEKLDDFFYRAYRFVGLPEDVLRWSEEYRGKYPLRAVSPYPDSPVPQEGFLVKM